MPHRVLIVDVDGVLADYVLGVCEIARSIDPAAPMHTHATAPGGSYDKWLLTSMGPVFAELERRKDEFWGTLLPIPDLHERAALRDLRADKYFVTARTGETAKSQTELWLRRHGFSVDPTVVVVNSLAAKGAVARAIGATHVIDDHADALASYVADSGGFKIYGRRWLYNEAFESTAVRWVHSLGEFVADVERGR